MASRDVVEGVLMDDVVVADSEGLQEKIKRVQEATEPLCVVADWDRTLTKARTEAGEDTTSYLAIVHGNYLDVGYRKEMDRLYRKYRPIEVSQTASAKGRKDAMHNWWSAAFALMRTYGLTKAMIDDIAQRDLMRLRDGAADFFAMLLKRDIPVWILSAGIGNVIDGFLRARDLLTSNVRVVSNTLMFEKTGMVNGFVEPVIHSLNKCVETHGVGVETQGRCYLLLGDTLEDARMVDGVDCETVIRVGFLNEGVDTNRDAYLRVYDVLICEDGDMEYVNQLLGGMLAD